MPRVSLAYENDQGEPGELSGKVQGGGPKALVQSWVQNRHPLHSRWADAEGRQRASYVATRDVLAPYLVPHRFEGATEGKSLRRAKLGYGVRLNASWLSDIMGHIRSAPATYAWGAMESAQAEDTQSAPTQGVAARLWADATLENTTWRNFFERKALEWMCASPGGFVLVDGTPAGASGEADRPSLMFIPWGWVTDVGRTRTGFRFVRLLETVDTRDPKAKDQKPMERRHVLYTLQENGDTLVERFNDDGKPIGEPVTIEKVVDRQGQPTLPLLPVRYGEHPAASWLGSGLLLGLDDIVLDLYNLQSETREGYRDVSFGCIAYRGPQGDVVEAALKEGSRFLDLGDNEHSTVERLAAESAEVTAGLALVKQSLDAWALSAKRKAVDAMERAEAQSGVSMKAEFQLDLRPLLVEVTETLDALETDAMFIAGQMAGLEAPALRGVGVTRATEFQLEDEASRLSRIVTEASGFMHLVPAEAKARIVWRWLEASGALDLDEEVALADGTSIPLRDLIPDRIRELAEQEETAGRRRADAAGIAALGI